MKILLVQTGFLGDTILSTPVIAAIKQLYSDSRLYMLTTPAARDLVALDPLLESCLAYDKHDLARGPIGTFMVAQRLKAMQFDIAYGLHRSFRSAMLLWLSEIPLRIGFKDSALPFVYHQRRKRLTNAHDVMRNLSLMADDFKEQPPDTTLRLFAPDRGRLNPGLREVLPPEGEYAVLVPGSVWPTKRWPWQGYRRTAEYLLEKGKKVVLAGAPSEKDLNRLVAQRLAVTDLTGQTTIAEMMTLVKEAALVVCNDSMSLHMASAFKVPTVAVFCATSRDFGFGPWENRAIVVEKDLACRPCRRHGGRKCPNKTEACMEELPATEVIEAIEKLRISWA